VKDPYFQQMQILNRMNVEDIHFWISTLFQSMLEVLSEEQREEIAGLHLKILMSKKINS
jgi:gluconate kinase